VQYGLANPGLTKWIQSLKDDVELQNAITDEESDPVPYLSRGVEDMIARMDEATLQLDELIERSGMFLQVPADPVLPHESKSQGRLAEENAVLRQQLADRQAEHSQYLRQAENDHTRHELQDELARLRTELAGETLARQALSAELRETTRDQSDMVAALQAELVQEKDRSTDLGVRLQEALLDVDGLKSAESTMRSQVQALQDERSRLHQTVSDMENGSRQLQSQLAGIQAELEATAAQLGQARTERDAAMKNQSAEAERLMRDHIAEADGDRAVLEHQNLTLSKQLEDLRIEMEEKITAVKNTSIRTADGLKAELSFTKAQFRDVQRRETILADELAMAKDTAQAMTQKEAHHADVTRDAVTLATKYHDVCLRIITAITASSTISASTHIRPKSPTPAVDKPIDSLLGRSLATADAFDLEYFADAINKTISLVKKLSKHCRNYRDVAKNKISFTAFGTGDLALFLPTRNAATRPWMAYNVSAPHHFLQVPSDKLELWKTRDSIIARIVGTEEAVAGDVSQFAE
jgi:autophagy-related protein 11